MLIVIADRDHGALMAEALAEEGHVVVGPDAVERADTVITDLEGRARLSLEAARSVVQALRRRYAGARVVVVSTDPRLRERLDEIDADAFVAKPFDIADLVSAIDPRARVPD